MHYKLIYIYIYIHIYIYMFIFIKFKLLKIFKLISLKHNYFNNDIIIICLD